jgi:hypothetical protein
MRSDLRSHSSDPGQNLSLSTTNATQFSAAKCSFGAMVSAPLSNTAAVYVAYDNDVTTGATGTGIELQPGDREFFPCFNVSQLWARTATATQNVHAVAV